MVLAHFWNRSICNQMCFQCGQSSLNYSITAWSEFYVWIWNSGRRFQCMYKVRQPVKVPSENLYLSQNKTDSPVQIPPEEIRQKGRHCSRGREVGGRADKWGEQPLLKFSVPHRPNPHYSRQGERCTEVCTQWLGLRCHFTLFPPSVPPSLPYGRTQKFVEPLMYGRKHQLPPCPLPLHWVGNEFQLILFTQCGIHMQWAREHVMDNHWVCLIFWSPSESQIIFSSHARSLWAVQIRELACFWPLLAGIVQFLKLAIFSPWGQRKKSFRPDLGFGQVEP